MILRVHQEGERHLEGIGDFRLAQLKLVVGTDARDRRQDAVAGEGEIEVEIADRLDQRRAKPDLLARLAQGGSGRGPVIADRSCRRERRSGRDGSAARCAT